MEKKLDHCRFCGKILTRLEGSNFFIFGRHLNGVYILSLHFTAEVNSIGGKSYKRSTAVSHVILCVFKLM